MEFFAPINEIRAANNRITTEIFAARNATENAVDAALRPRLRRHRLIEPVAA